MYMKSKNIKPYEKEHIASSGIGEVLTEYKTSFDFLCFYAYLYFTRGKFTVYKNGHVLWLGRFAISRTQAHHCVLAYEEINIRKGM